MENQELSHSLSQHSHTLIYCFICGIAYKQSHFISHYTECKSNYLSSLNFKIRPLKEPQGFDSLLLMIQRKEDITSLLEEYNKIVEDIHFELIYKQCPKCNKKFYPNAYLKHSSKCNKKRSMTDCEITKVMEEIDEMGNCKVMKKRRKMSMENLKLIAKDEIKGFKHFNLLRYLNK